MLTSIIVKRPLGLIVFFEMVDIETRWEGEYVGIYLNGEKVPRDKIPEFVDKYMKPRDIDEYPPLLWEEMRKWSIVLLAPPDEEGIPL